MAEKRILEAVGTMSYSKLPRLEGDPAHVLPVGVCQSSRLPDLPVEDHYSYKGSYFTFPLQGHEMSKTLTPWLAGENYSHCPASAPGHSPRTEKATCRSEIEGLKARQRLPGSEEVNECISRERWASYVGHTGVIQQGWLQGYPAQQLPPAPAPCTTLAAPKPVYRNNVYGTESGYSSKRALTFRMQMENYSKRLEWSSPSSVLPAGVESCGYGTAGSRKNSVVAENGAVQFRQGSKEGAVHSAGFVPYRKTLEKCQRAQNGSSLDASYPSAGQKSSSESPTGSNSRKHMWSRLAPSTLPPPPPPPPLSSLLVNRQDLAYQERSPSCYPLGSYPLTSHEQMLLYHQSYVQAEKSNSVFALAACKGFGSSPSREDGQMFPGSYFQQTSRSCYPRHLESYVYQAVVPPPLPPSEELHSSREHEHPQNVAAKVDFAPKAPVSACVALEKPAPACSPWRIRGGLPNWCESSRIAREASTNFSSLQAFPPNHQGDRLSHCYNRVEKMEENGCKKDFVPPEKVTEEKEEEEEEESSETQKKLSLAYESRKRSITPHKNEAGGCSMISDSLVVSHNPYSKPALPKNVPKAPNVQPASHGCWSPEDQPKGLHHEQREGPSTSSPPMPVINNVFSLAPYQAYLEGSADLVELDAAQRCQAGESPPNRRSKSVENGFVLWTGSQRMTKESRLGLRREEGTTRNTITEVGEADLNKKGLTTGQGGGNYAGPWESSKVKLLNPTDPVSCQPSPANHSNGRVERLTQGDHVLDLSFKTEDLAEQPGFPQLPKKAEAPDVGGPKIQGEEVKERAANSRDSVSQANGETINGDSRGNRHFHSSAAFLYKKFKILKAHAAEAASGVKDVSLPKGTDAQVTEPNSPLVGPSLPQPATPPETLILQIQCLNAKLPNAPTFLPPNVLPGSPALREIQVLDSATEKLLGQQKYSPRQYFVVLHTCVCTLISGSVSTSSPDQLKAWLEMSEPTVELQEKTVSSSKPKNGSKVSEGPKLSKGKEIWLAFKGVEVLVKKLQSQLEIFLLYKKCPFPHVMRAGAIFIPIHVVKEELFPNLPGVSVDHVLQDHKVELRPTTLSEEKAFRDLDLKSCTSRMLKLLALKQLPDIYLDLLTLHWHECVKQELEDPAKPIPNREVEALGTDATTESLDQGFQEKSTRGQTCGLAACFGTTSLHYETLQAEDKETLARCSSPSLQRGCVLNGVKVLPKEDAALETKGLPLHPSARRPSHKQPRTLELKLTAKVARRTTRASKILHLRKSVVHIQFQNALQDIQGPQILGPSGKRKKVPPPLLLKRFKHRRHSRAKVSSLPSEYPELVGKRIRHLYEEKDKTEAWYQGVVLRVHKPHKNPLKTVYEVKYDSEPEWQYYLEILQDYKKGWVELDE